ncbi:DUF4876 domain-containing protein [Sinomicrobium sp.]
MKRFLMLCMCVFTIACSKDDDGDFVAPISHSFHVLFEESYGNSKPVGAELIMTNREDGKKYSGTSDSEGEVALDVIPGVYNINVSLILSKEEYLEFSGQEVQGDVSFNASLEGVAINQESETFTELVLTTGRIGDLLIKQIYYAGSDVRLGALYRDQFFEIHNNSNETIYLDGLCFAQIYGEASMSGETEPFQLPNGQLDWSQAIGQGDVENANTAYVYSDEVLRFPGSGQEYPLESGKSVIVAATAINHKAPLVVVDDEGEEKVFEVQEPERTIDLSTAPFEAYYRPFQESQGSSYLDSDIDNPNAVNMEIVFKSYGGKDLILDTNGRDAFVIFKADTETVASWDALPSPETLIGNINENTSAYLQIPVDVVIDGVELQRNDPAKAKPKRLPDTVDAGEIANILGAYSSESVIRKVSKKVGDKTFYQDTNNSSNDFKVLEHPEVIIE